MTLVVNLFHWQVISQSECLEVLGQNCIETVVKFSFCWAEIIQYSWIKVPDILYGLHSNVNITWIIFEEYSNYIKHKLTEN